MNISKSIISLATAVLLLTACQETLEEKCQRECKLYTKKNCPAQLDKNVIIDSLTFEASTHTLHYHYTLTGQADSVGILSQEEVKKALLGQLRNSTTMKSYKDEGYTFTYTYHSQRRPSLVLFEQTLTKKDYQQKK